MPKGDKIADNLGGSDMYVIMMQDGRKTKKGYEEQKYRKKRKNKAHMKGRN